MHSRFPLALALLAALAAPALAGGGPSRLPLMPGAAVLRYGGATVPFTVDVNLARTRTQPGGPLQILVTAVTPENGVVTLDSRPVLAGEKLTWTGTLPARGVLVIRVLDDRSAATSTELRRGSQPICLVITGAASVSATAYVRPAPPASAAAPARFAEGPLSPAPVPAGSLRA